MSEAGEKRAIELAERPSTTATLARELRALGVREGGIYLVHSSLSSLGWVCGEEMAVVKALIEAVGQEGTLVMPAHTSANSDPAEWRHPPVPEAWLETIRAEMPAFERDKSPSRGMGRIAECFRKWPGTLRSDHPHVSFTARGKYAAEIVRTHVLTPFFGLETPLGELYRREGSILLLGVGYGNCTAFHLGEALSGKQERVRNGCAMLENGGRVWRWYEDFDYDADDFPAIGAEYEKTGAVKRAKAGCADCRLMALRPAVDFARDYITKNR